MSNTSEAKLLDLVRGSSWDDPAHRESVFETLATEVLAFQVKNIEAFGRYVAHVSAGRLHLSDWREIPPVPASAFKSHDLSAAPPEVDGKPGSPGVVFETSGTSISSPGRIRLSSTALYEASLSRNFERHLLPDGARLPVLVFGPTRAEAPHSSLWFMVDHVASRFGTSGAWVVQEGTPHWEIADEAMEAAACRDQPILLLGTTLLFMAYFERLRTAGRGFALPRGSRAMDTGGAKGRRAEFSRADVETAFEQGLGIHPTHLVNEYGMAEMASQFYDDNLLAHHEGREPLPGKRIPPWVRTRVLDPQTLEEVPEGGRGILVHYDLANFEIPLAIQTEDVGSVRGDRLLIEGRLLGAEARGCSLRFEQFLEAERGAERGAARPVSPAKRSRR